MSVKSILLIGSTLMLAACASQSAIDETGDIAAQFCLTQSPSDIEARKVLLSPSLAKIMHDTKIRSGAVFDDSAPAPAVTVVETTETTVITDDAGMMPPVFDSAYNGVTDTTLVTQTETVAMAPPVTVETPPAPVCKPGRMFTMNGVRYAEIHHGDGLSKGGWTDRLVLKNINGRWMIDDILFAPDYHRSMRQTLIRAE